MRLSKSYSQTTLDSGPYHPWLSLSLRSPQGEKRPATRVSTLLTPRLLNPDAASGGMAAAMVSARNERR